MHDPAMLLTVQMLSKLFWIVVTKMLMTLTRLPEDSLQSLVYWLHRGKNKMATRFPPPSWPKKSALAAENLQKGF